jgi:hypothetical protein
MEADFVLQASGGRAYPIRAAMRVGREKSCQIVLPNDSLVSRVHSTIWVEQGALYVRDEESRNGTFVNGQRIAPGQPRLLRAGDELRVGDTRFFVAAPREAATAPASSPQPPAANVTNCAQCGAMVPAGNRFCGRCGTPLSAIEPQPVISVMPPRPSARPSVARGLSVWWLIVPTLIYAFLSRNLVNTLILAVIAGGLRYAQTRPEVPTGVRPYLPLLQPVLVFLFLGGNPLVIAVVGAALVGAVQQHSQLLAALGPWWQIQEQIPLLGRRVLAVVFTLLIGYFFGVRAAGSEWTYTFLSMITGTVVTFLLLFTPPASLRKPVRGRST